MRVFLDEKKTRPRADHCPLRPGVTQILCVLQFLRIPCLHWYSSFLLFINCYSLSSALNFIFRFLLSVLLERGPYLSENLVFVTSYSIIAQVFYILPIVPSLPMIVFSHEWSISAFPSIETVIWSISSRWCFVIIPWCWLLPCCCGVTGRFSRKSFFLPFPFFSNLLDRHFPFFLFLRSCCIIF